VIAKQLGLPVIPFALRKNVIWDSKKKTECKAGWKALFAIHVCFVCEQAAMGCAQLKRILQWYYTSGELNYYIRSIQCLNPFEMLALAVTKNHCACMWHDRGVGSMLHIKIPDLIDPNQLCKDIPTVTHPRTLKEQSFTAKHYLFSLAPKKAGKSKELVLLVLLVEATFTGGEHYVTVAHRHAA
jgi:hypothetical protein